MRIIGGRLKGKTILPPQGYKARPTTDFAKEGLFNVLNNEYELEGLQVLDLFGGTGAISYEFASRGASRVYCVEMLPLHANFIKSQAAKFGMDNLTVVRHNVFEFLEIRDITDEEIAQMDRIRQGVDWGWFPDPYAFIRLHYDKTRGLHLVF